MLGLLIFRKYMTTQFQQPLRVVGTLSCAWLIGANLSGGSSFGKKGFPPWVFSRFPFNISHDKGPPIVAFRTTVDKLIARLPPLSLSALTAQKLRANRYILTIFLNPVEWMLTEPGEKSRIF